MFAAQLTIHQLGIAGGISGIFTTAIMVPGDRIKVMLQVGSNTG